MIPVAKPSLDKQEQQAVLDVIKSGMIASGQAVTDFEIAFAKLFNYKHVIACSSGTAALHAALIAHDIGQGDEVITTPFSFIATANTILATGAIPVFVDIDRETFNLDPNLIESKITSKTKAIMPVHLYGHSADNTLINQIAKKHKLLVIEDACQAHGAIYPSFGKSKYVGSQNTASFSLYPTKNMTSAEGGLIVTSNNKIAEKVRQFINHGQSRRYVHTTFGLNYRMTNLHAAIGLEQTKKLPDFTAKRQRNAKYLIKKLTSLQLIKLPVTKPGYTHVYHQFTIRIPEQHRDKIAEKLNQAGIGTGIHYPISIPKQPYYKKLGFGNEKYSQSENAAREVLSLPIHPLVSLKDLDYIAETLITAVKQTTV